MALVHADRVKETSTTTGTGTLSLAGAETGFRTFVAGIGNGNSCWYVIEDGADWEVGIGTVTDATPDTLSRTTILASSNGGAAVNWSAGTKYVYCAHPAGKVSKVVAEFKVQDAEFPASNPATPDTRNNHPVLDFDASTNETVYFTGRMPDRYSGGGLRVKIHYSMSSATSGDVDWDVAIERIGDQQLDVDADSFAAANSVDNTTVPGTSGNVDVVEVTFTDGADMDSLAAGEMFRLSLTRDAASDTAAGDAEVHRVTVEEA